MEATSKYEVIIIGGSYAGLSAAMALGRSLRKVLIIDGGQPCNRFTPHSHNFITHDGEQPKVIADKAKEQVLKYKTVSFKTDIAVAGRTTEDGFVITTQSGQEFGAKKLIFATGIEDIWPNIQGFGDCWGISIIHCPYCHGYEFRNRQTAIMANGEKAFHLASLVNNLTAKLTIFTNGAADFNDTQLGKLQKNNIKINEQPILEVKHENGNLQRVIFKNGTHNPLDALYAAIPFKQQSDIPASLGCGFTEHGHIITDSFQKTTVQGVFACGDNSAMMRSVANAIHSGNLTGAIVNKELTEENF